MQLSEQRFLAGDIAARQAMRAARAQPRAAPPTGHRNGIKWQHRRPLCLAVHPDKNPSAAADGAFKVVQAAYDIRRVACGGSRRAHGVGLGGRSCSVPLLADDGQYVESVLCRCQLIVYFTLFNSPSLVIRSLVFLFKF